MIDAAIDREIRATTLLEYAKEADTDSQVHCYLVSALACLDSSHDACISIQQALDLANKIARMRTSDNDFEYSLLTDHMEFASGALKTSLAEKARKINTYLEEFNY